MKFIQQTCSESVGILVQYFSREPETLSFITIVSFLQFDPMVNLSNTIRMDNKFLKKSKRLESWTMESKYLNIRETRILAVNFSIFN